MLALQSTPLHLRDQNKQERRFDQPILFAGYQHHHNHHYNPGQQSRRNHPRHHSYHHPTPVSSSSSPCSTTTATVALPSRHQQHQALFYRECDLKQDLSIANARVMSQHHQHTTVSNHSKSNSIHFGSSFHNHHTMPSNLCATSIQNCTDQTPIQKIEARIAQMTMEDYSKEKIVLILTGSFCPIHVHHIEMLKAAKECMEKEQGGAGAAMILGGFVSPSHDDYVGEKLKGDALCLNSQERMELCRLQTADSDWIDVDPWEATQSEFYDYHKVTSRLQLFLQEKCQSTLENKMGALLQDQQRRQSLVGHTFGQKTPNSKSVAQMVPQRSGSPESNRNPFNIRVVYICGADFVLRTGAHKLFGGIVVVDRPLGPPSGRRSILLVNTGGHIDVPVSDQMENSEGMEAPPSSSGPTTSVAMTVRERVFQKLTKSYGAQWCESNRNNIWWLPARSSGETGDVSSTRIRKLLTEKGTCEGLLHPAVARRLREKLDSQERP